MSRRQRNSTAPLERPTYRNILDQAVVVLNEDGYDRFSVQRVLDEAEVSRATLYRYFPDVDSLIEAAMIESFRIEMNLFLGILTALVEQATDAATFRDGVRTVVHDSSHLPSEVRLRRAHIIALASTRPALAEGIAATQEALTNGWDATFREAQRRGFVRDDVDTRALAVIIQSIGIGRIIDDAAISQLGDERWADTYFQIVERAILSP